MQPTTQPQAATAPAQTGAPPPTVTTVGPGGTTQTLTIPKTSAEVEALLVQRQELAEQLNSVSARRHELSEEIRIAPEGASRTGLEERIRLLDQRILQIETDIAATGSQLASAPAELVSSAQVENPPSGDNFEAGWFAGAFSVLAFFAVVYAYRRFRRRRRGPKVPAQLPTEPGRLERLEQGMESIAIEIERISEGQRFVTRLLSESQTPLGVSHRVPQSGALESEGPAKR